MHYFCETAGSRWGNMVRVLLLLLALGPAGCTVHNPAICCETEAECAAVGFDDPATCDMGVCVNQTCAASGCDGDEDCLDPLAANCVAGVCRDLQCLDAGGRILFLSNKDGDDDIYVANADGSSAVAVTTTAGSERVPRWSPDGTRIGFIAPVAGGGVDLFVAPASGEGSAVNLTNTSAVENTFEWAPDGQHVAFDVGDPPRLHVVAVDGSGDITIRSELDSASESLPTWAPDGTKVAFRAVSMTGAVRMWQAGIDGTASTQLTLQPIDALHWSPDGLKIGAISLGDLWMFDLGTGVFLQQTNAVLEFEWAPDGSAYTFVREDLGNRDVWTADSDGAGERNVTSNPGIDDHPRWSPDGKHLAFESMRDGNREVYRVSRDGSNPQNITNDTAAESSPDWSDCQLP